jgi:hypothetical protein
LTADFSYGYKLSGILKSTNKRKRNFEIRSWQMNRVFGSYVGGIAPSKQPVENKIPLK